MELPRSRVSELLPESKPILELGLELSGHDDTLAKLIKCVQAEIDHGCVSGQLFTDGLCLALMGYLQSKYSEKKTARNLKVKMARSQTALISAYVEAHLDSDLRIVELARLLDMSPQHFSRLFKASLGVTPHQYVMRRRVEAAQRLLRTNATIPAIAYALGFSNQAHFTQVFRRHVGTTPGRAREGQLHSET
jgi:AraC family transcriptional regulator